MNVKFNIPRMLLRVFKFEYDDGDTQNIPDTGIKKERSVD